MATAGIRNPAGAVSVCIAQVLGSFVPSVCAAQDDSPLPQGWDCLRCALDEGWSLDMRIGPAASIDGAFEFGDSTGVYDTGGFLFADLFGGFRDADGRYASLEAWSRGTSAFGAFAEGGRQGVWQTHASVQSIPRYLFDTTMTPFLRSSDSRLTLPADWIRAPATHHRRTRS